MLRINAQGSRRVDFALLLVAMAWGSSYLATKDVVTTRSVFAFLALRFAIGTVALGLLLAPRLRKISGSEVAVGVLFGALLCVIFTLEAFGVAKTSAANAGLIIATTMVMTPLLERALGRRDLPGKFYIAALVAITGIVLLTQGQGFALPNLGDVLILMAALSRAIYVIVVARASAGRVLDSSRVTWVQMCTALVAFVGLSQVTAWSPWKLASHFNGRAWILTTYLALACTVFAFLIQMWAVRRTSPARVSLLLGTEPLWAAAVGVCLAGDALTVISFIGAALLVAGTNWGRTVESRRLSRVRV